MELLDGGSATLVGGDHLHLHDLDGVGAGAMASSHVTVWRHEQETLRTSCHADSIQLTQNIRVN